ncbi:MAG: hypothetical protein DDT39_00307 [Firmicutes bacterium]|nr:hypothetical protein [candidate division NPL-UPA2 bacterium]
MQVRRTIALVLLSLILLGLPASAQDEAPPADVVVEFARGRVLTLEELPPEEGRGETGFELREFDVQLEVLSGTLRGQTVDIRHVLTGTPAFDVVVMPGQRVLIAIEKLEGDAVEVAIADHERDRHLLALVIGFGALLIGLGGKKGFFSLISLALIGVLIIYVLIPLLLRGYNPITLAVVVAAVATAFTTILVGGANRKAAAAIVGTVGGLVVAGVLAIVVGGAIHTTGLAGEEAQMLAFIPQGVDFDFRGLLMAGIIIGALGAIMDTGMTISSAISEVQRASPGLRRKELFWVGMNVGRDVSGTMANTLILAYTGGSLALLLLVQAYEIEFIRLVNMDSIASEVLRALAGSIGLVSAIPLTALAAAFLARTTNKAD